MIVEHEKSLGIQLLSETVEVKQGWQGKYRRLDVASTLSP